MITTNFSKPNIKFSKRYLMNIIWLSCHVWIKGPNYPFKLDPPWTHSGTPQYFLGTKGASISISVWISTVLWKWVSWQTLPDFIQVQGLGQPWNVQTGLPPAKLHQKMLSKHLVWSAHSTRLNLVLSKNCTRSRWEFVELTFIFTLKIYFHGTVQLAVTETYPRGAQEWQTALWLCRTANIIVQVLSLLLHENGRTQISV